MYLNINDDADHSFDWSAAEADLTKNFSKSKTENSLAAFDSPDPFDEMFVESSDKKILLSSQAHYIPATRH